MPVPAYAPPVAVVLGTPRQVVELVGAEEAGPVVCYQMDEYPAERLREELASAGLDATVRAGPDLWDLEADFQTAVYPASRGGDVGLKRDMVEQAFHILRPGGALIVHSPYVPDQFFPAVMKKGFGKVKASPHEDGTDLVARRTGDRPRRRHEMTFHARVGADPSLHFVSRPGTFSYGEFDEGARALVETMTVHEGDRILDVGCGCGTNGVFAALRSGPVGHVTFVDSNHRAIALAEMNAQANGVTNFQTRVTSRLDGLPEASFDVALANPPYYAVQAIARLFVERCRVLLKPGGHLYLVTKQPHEVAPLVAESFSPPETVLRRGYSILLAKAPERRSRR